MRNKKEFIPCLYAVREIFLLMALGSKQSDFLVTHFDPPET